MIKKIIFFIVFSLCSLSLLHAQTWLWGEYGISSLGNDGQILSEATDTKGNIYDVGYFLNTLTFDSNILIDTGKHNCLSLFIIKYDPNGNPLWVRQSEGSNHCAGGNGYSLAIDENGNAYVTAMYNDTIIFGSFRLTCSASGGSYVVKYDPNGNVIWAKNAILASLPDEGGYSNSIAADRKGNSYITGGFTDTVTFGAYTLIDTIEGSFLVRYNTTGNVVWAKQSTDRGNGGTDPSSVITDDFGNEYIEGLCFDTATFGTFTLLPSGNEGCFMAKYDSSGNVLWAKRIGGGYGYYPLTTDKNGNVYLSGSFNNSIIFGNDTLNSPSPDAFFIVKYTSNGDLIWAKQSYPLDNNSWYSAISADQTNHLYLSVRGENYHNSKIIYDKDTISYDDTAVDDYVSIIMQLDTAGNLLCHSVIGGGGAYYQEVTADSSGYHVYLAGTLNTPVIFGSDSLFPILPQQFPFVARWFPCDTSIPTSVNQIVNTGAIMKVYPNPNTGIFTVALQNVNEPTRIEIYNVLGEKILTEPLLSNTINISNQPDGIYLIRVLTNEGELVGQSKLVKEQ